MAAAVVYAGGGSQPGSAPRRTTLEFLGPSPSIPPNGFDAVLEEVYKQTDSTLNIRINYVFTEFTDVGQKISLRIAAGEQLDGAFVAQWTNPSMQQMISQGLLTNLDSFFNNDQYPGLKKYFQKDYLDANSFADAKGETHVYAVPFADGFGQGTEGIFYRQDLADKYGIGKINSYDDLIRYFEAIKKNETAMQPFVTLEGLPAWWWAGMIRDTPQTSQHNTDNISGTPFSVVIGDDGKAYVSRHFIPAMDPKYRSMVKGPYANEDPLFGAKHSQEWYQKGYIGSDPLNDKDREARFYAGRAAAFHGNASGFVSTQNSLKASLPNAELGVWIWSPNFRFNMKKTEGSGFNAWNFLAVPSTSKNLNKVMDFMEWIYSDRNHYDLLSYGIPGKNWIPVGNDKMDTPANFNPASDAYGFPNYILALNPQLLRFPVNMPDDVLKVTLAAGDASTFYKFPTSGFSFVSDAVESEMAKLNDLNSYQLAVNCGVYSNLEAEVVNIQRRFDEAGFAKAAAEAERQFNEFLKKNPYEGQ
jgi:putative aldouronate transport system substrate-binding protein